MPSSAQPPKVAARVLRSRGVNWNSHARPAAGGTETRCEAASMPAACILVHSPAPPRDLNAVHSVTCHTRPAAQLTEARLPHRLEFKRNRQEILHGEAGSGLRLEIVSFRRIGRGAR